MLKSLFVKIKEKKRFLNNRQFCSLIIKTLLRKVSVLIGKLII